MIWQRSHGFDRRALPLADRHYNRQKPGTRQFVPPGRRLVLLTPHADALWVTSWPFFSQHAWPGAWVCTIFRNESHALSSDLIRQAIAATRFHFDTTPQLGMITFVDATRVRHKRDPGRCFLKAGFRHVANTSERNLLALQILPADMPPPEPAGNVQLQLSTAS